MSAQSRTALFLDLDGTCTDLDILPIINGKEGPKEVACYLQAAAEFVARSLPGISAEEVHRGILIALKKVFPQRSRYCFWAVFFSAQKKGVKLCPSVDHYLLIPHGIHIFLEDLAAQNASSVLQAQIAAYFAKPNWQHALFTFCSEASLPLAHMNDDACSFLEEKLKCDGFVAIFTNSSAQRARVLAERAGFGRFLIEGRLERGRLSLISEAKKFLIDEEWPSASKPSHVRFGDRIDLSPYFGEKEAVVDLRRPFYYEIVKKLLKEADIKEAWMVSDIASLDLFPFANWLEFNPRVAMRVHETSSPEEIDAVRALLAIEPAKTLSAACPGL